MEPSPFYWYCEKSLTTFVLFLTIKYVYLKRYICKKELTFLKPYILTSLLSDQKIKTNIHNYSLSGICINFIPLSSLSTFGVFL